MGFYMPRKSSYDSTLHLKSKFSMKTFMFTLTFCGVGVNHPYPGSEDS